MTTLLRVIRLISLAVWVGGLAFFGFVASIALQTLPDPHQAGAVVRGSLIMLHRLGLAAGAIYLIVTLALLATQRDSHPVRAAELALVIAMLALTAYSQFSVIPKMEADRIALGGDVDRSPKDDPAHRQFDRLHDLSVKLEGAILIEGLLLLAMAPVHGRDDFDRFS
jgi:putative copper export protein